MLPFICNRLGLAALALGAGLLLVPAASAQVRLAPSPQRLFPVNTNPEIAPGVRLQQYAYNTAVLGKAYGNIPPYMLGYNPYPVSVNYGPVYNPQVFRPSVYNPQATPYYGSVVPPGVPYAGGYSPYGASSYAGGYSAGGVDPLTGMPGSGGGYSPYSSNPYYWNPYSGGYNYGSAMDIMAYGQLGLNIEQARILQEQAAQAKLDTRKKTVDTLAYLRANEYTFTQEQIDIGKKLLERVQKVPTESDVSSGKSLNILLADLVKFSNDKKLQLPTVTLDRDVLKLVNLRGSGSSGNIGLLRDDGKFTWPAAFDDKNVIAEKDRKEIESEAQTLYKQAVNSKMDPNTLKDLESSLAAARTNLDKQVDGMSIANFLEGQRFLDDFNAAVIALKKGDLVLNLDFQQKFLKDESKTLQELVDYMGSRGLKFAPSLVGEERAYRALQSGMSAQSLAIHNQISLSSKGN